MAFPYYKQPDAMDCGPTCIRMVAKHFGRNYTVQTLRKLCEINRESVSLPAIERCSRKNTGHPENMANQVVCISNHAVGVKKPTP